MDPYSLVFVARELLCLFSFLEMNISLGLKNGIFYSASTSITTGIEPSRAKST